LKWKPESLFEGARAHWPPRSGSLRRHYPVQVHGSLALARQTLSVTRRRFGSPNGLTEAEAETRLAQYGPNEVAHERKHEWLHRLWTAVRNPLVVLLTVLSILSYATDDFPGGTVMLVMVILGVTLRFVQETRAGNAAAKLKAMIKVTATVLRDGQQKEIPLNNSCPATW
jgi:Mg2+-importing ATPase